MKLPHHKRILSTLTLDQLNALMRRAVRECKQDIQPLKPCEIDWACPTCKRFSRHVYDGQRWRCMEMVRDEDGEPVRCYGKLDEDGERAVAEMIFDEKIPPPVPAAPYPPIDPRFDFEDDAAVTRYIAAQRRRCEIEKAKEIEP